jgi:hypothetical protein
MPNIKLSYNGENYLISHFNKRLITKKYLSWLNDKELMQFSRHKFKKFYRKDCIKFYRQIKRNKHLFLAFYFTSNKEKIHIGNSIILLDRVNKSGEMSVLIGDKKFNNKGLATYFWGVLINYLFKKCKLRLIISGTMAVNKSMIKVFLKNKMKLYISPKRFLYNKSEINGINAYIVNKKF